MSKKKTEIEEDPTYRKICTSLKSCSAERKVFVSGDMSITSCHQCFQVLDWEKISTPKIKLEEKAKNKMPEPVKEVVVEEYMEPTPVVETPKFKININKVENKEDDETAKKAENMRKVFAEVDSIMENPVAVKKTVPEVSVITDPFGESVVKQSFFEINDAKGKNATTVRLVVWNEEKNNKWLLDVETNAEKVIMIAKNPSLMIGKYVKVEYLSLDSKQNPVDPKYLGMKPKEG